MKLLFALVMLGAAASAQTADTLSIYKPQPLSTWSFNRPSGKTPVMLAQKGQSNLVIPKLNLNFTKTDFLPGRITVNDALRQNLMLSDPYLRAMMTPSAPFYGGSSGDAVEMLVPANNGFTVWSSK